MTSLKVKKHRLHERKWGNLSCLSLCVSFSPACSSSPPAANHPITSAAFQKPPDQSVSSGVTTLQADLVLFVSSSVFVMISC